MKILLVDGILTVCVTESLQKAMETRPLNEHTWQHRSSNELLLFLGVCGMWVNDIKCL